MKRSPSGTQQPAEETRLSTVVVIAALAIVLAFAGSLIFGLKRSSPKVEVTDEQPAPQQPLVVNDRRAKVEVQNGSGKSGLAKLATNKLRDAGFDVVQFGNASAQSPTSQVIDRVGNRKAATDIATSLGIAKVTTAIDSSRFVDVTVVLGKDWPPKSAKK